ncbi:MAG: hypothetical protein LBE91_00400 [Tannerella sp.]|jgi:hypothetical protein|nr:hypothetical protein [Tannerella sp.]
MIKTTKSKESMRELAMLRYQADKYRLAGNGFMSQRLDTQIRKMYEKMATEAK